MAANNNNNNNEQKTSLLNCHQNGNENYLRNRQTFSNRSSCNNCVEVKVMSDIERTARDLAYDIVHNAVGSGWVASTNIKRHSEVMRRITSEMYERYEARFSRMIEKLELDRMPNNEVHAMFVHVLNEMFADSRYNWGRVVAVYTFGAQIAKVIFNRSRNDPVMCDGQKECSDVQNITARLNEVAEMVGQYVCHVLGRWIHDNGGWEKFDEFFAVQKSTFEDNLWTGLCVTALTLGALAGIIATR